MIGRISGASKPLSPFYNMEILNLWRNKNMEKSEVMKALKALDEMVDLTLEACKKDITTKDGYGTMMVVVDKFKNSC